MTQGLRLEQQEAVATLWIDRQAKMNTITVGMRKELPRIFRDLDAAESVRVVVVRGAGGKAFSSSRLPIDTDSGRAYTLVPLST